MARGMSAAAAGRFARLPDECLDMIWARLPPNCIPFTMRQLSKEWRARFEQHTTVQAAGGSHLPGWAVQRALPLLEPKQLELLMPVLARRGTLWGMQQVANHLDSIADGRLLDCLQAAAQQGRVDMICWAVDEWQDCITLAKHGSVAVAAAEAGQTLVLQWLLAQQPNHTWGPAVLAAAARGGHVQTLQWLLRCRHGRDACVAQAAAKAGQLDVLRLLKLKGYPWDKYACRAAAKAGHLHVLQWLSVNGCPWDVDACAAAAKHGHLHVLQWLRASGCLWDAQGVAEAAAKGGALEVLQYMAASGFEFDEWVMDAACGKGQLRAVQWLHEHGCPWHAGAWWRVAAAGNMDVVRYLHTHGCPTAGTDPSHDAALGGCKEMLLWLREEIGYEWTAKACLAAAQSTCLPLLRWLRAQTPPCPWDAATVHAIVHRRSLYSTRATIAECLEFALSNGCPWDAADFEAAQQQPDLKHVKWPGM